MTVQKILIGGTAIAPGQRLSIDLPVASLYTHTPVIMPVHVVRGRQAGPALFVCAAIHGDEINGVEIIRRLLQTTALKRMRGMLVCIPIVNVFGFLNHSRYLPDRRDLNRSFPGSQAGSLTARLANIFTSEILSNCTHGIDLHTGAGHRSNLPQIRANLDDAETEKLARAFGVPVLINANLRDGSLRQIGADRDVPILVYEGGEALRFNELAIRAGVQGVLAVMRVLEMLPRSRRRHGPAAPVVASATSWIRAPSSGIHRIAAELGARVRRGDTLGVISDPFGSQEITVTSDYSGIIIGQSKLPLCNEGDALFHIARFDRIGDAAERVEAFQNSVAGPDETLPDLVPPFV